MHSPKAYQQTLQSNWPSVLPPNAPEKTLEAVTRKGISIGVIDNISPSVGLREPTRNPMMSKESFEYGIVTPVRANDVMLVSPPKTGTTLMQQVCHQIKMHGGDNSMNFEDIYQVSPWLSWAQQLETNPNDLSSPRIFKTHQRLSSQRRGCRYIATIRDPETTFISYFNFLKQKDLPELKDCKDASDFVLNSDRLNDMMFGASLWEYYQEFIKAQNMNELLVIPYEHLSKNLTSVIPVVASFIGEPQLSQTELESIAVKCSKEFMMQHTSKFDESWVDKKLSQGSNEAPDNHTQPAARITSGDKTPLSDEAKTHLAQKWAETMECSSYQEMSDIFIKKLEERLVDSQQKKESADS